MVAVNKNRVPANYTYDPYGQVTIYTGKGNDNTWFTSDDVSSSTSAVENPYTFTGRRLDNETGLMYFRNRYYSVDLGRFISRDALEYVDGWNLYRGYFAVNGVDWNGNGAGADAIALGLATIYLKRLLQGGTALGRLALRIQEAIAGRTMTFPFAGDALSGTDEVKRKMKSIMDAKIKEICSKGEGQHSFTDTQHVTFFGAILSSILGKGTLKVTCKVKISKDCECKDSEKRYKYNCVWKYTDEIDAKSFEELIKEGNLNETSTTFQRVMTLIEGGLDAVGDKFVGANFYFVATWKRSGSDCCP